MGMCSEEISSVLKTAMRKDLVSMDEIAARRLGSVCNLIDKISEGLSGFSIKATLGASKKKLTISLTCTEMIVFTEEDDSCRQSFFALMNLIDSFRVDGGKGQIVLNFIINNVWGDNNEQ